MRRRPKFRCATKKSITKLASILGVSHTPDMQDWEWEIADPQRLREYIELYSKPHMNEDDRFTIMETMIQSIDDLFVRNRIPPKCWTRVQKLITSNPKLHQCSVLYWSSLDFDGFTPVRDCWKVSKEMNKLYIRLYNC